MGELLKGAAEFAKALLPAGVVDFVTLCAAAAIILLVIGIFAMKGSRGGGRLAFFVSTVVALLSILILAGQAGAAKQGCVQGGTDGSCARCEGTVEIVEAQAGADFSLTCYNMNAGRQVSVKLMGHALPHSPVVGVDAWVDFSLAVAGGTPKRVHNGNKPINSFFPIQIVTSQPVTVPPSGVVSATVRLEHCQYGGHGAAKCSVSPQTVLRIE